VLGGTAVRERERERESWGRSTGTGHTSCGVDDRSASLVLYHDDAWGRALLCSCIL
jgi:hypothetical protein